MSAMNWEEIPRSVLENPVTDQTGDVDLSLVEYNLSLSVADRIRQNDRALAMVKAFQKAGMKSRGEQPPGGVESTDPQWR